VVVASWATHRIGANHDPALLPIPCFTRLPAFLACDAPLFVILLMLAFPTAVYLPTHLLLFRIFRPAAP
jgi:hypothetical protein